MDCACFHFTFFYHRLRLKIEYCLDDNHSNDVYRLSVGFAVFSLQFNTTRICLHALLAYSFMPGPFREL